MSDDMAATLDRHPSALGIWVIDRAIDDGVLERLADARSIADALGEQVGVLVIGDATAQGESLIAAGADHVYCAPIAGVGQNTFVSAAAKILRTQQPRAVLASGDSWGRECACRLAARCGWRLVSPALMAEAQAGGRMLVTALDASGKLARRQLIGPKETVVVTLRPGIGEMPGPDVSRSGVVEMIDVQTEHEAVVQQNHLPADHTTVDIRHLRRLVAGGRGLGSRDGFDRLRRIAQKLEAGIAASRAAVDAGWIDHERQVGQTGKTVKPDLYIACGISGASHHLEGMSDSHHIVSINSDADAPIHKNAHLALVADLYDVLDHLERGLDS
jgi:electron transfer flavoprotein alpha subunit